MIPASQLNPRVLGLLVEYLQCEIRDALGARAPLEETWMRYEQAYRALPEMEKKDFPFQGAANLVLPVIATDVDTVFSRLMGLLFAPNNLWSCQPLNSAMVDYAPRIQEFLEWAQHAELGVYNAVADFTLEMCKLGTGVVKQRYTREQKRVYQWRESDFGTAERIMNLLITDHPTLQHVSLPDFLVPGSAVELQSSPWCAERLGLTYGQLQSRVRMGVYQGVDVLQRWLARDRGSSFEQFMQQMDGFQPRIGDRFDLWEAWLDYDIQGSGEPMAIVATLHLPTNTLLRVDYNPFFNQEKPYSVARYLRQPKRFYGIGLAEMLDQFQSEVTAMHNQRLDNATLANSSMFKARKNIGIKQNEPIFPGRWFLLDDLNDVQPMPMGQRYDSTIQNETMSLNYASRRTGVNDYISGESTPAIGYAAATTTLQQLREGSKRFDQVMREVRVCLGESGTRILELYQQFNQHGKEYLSMGAEDGMKVHKVLQFPMELIRTCLGVELTATSGSLNKDTQIRTDTIVMQLVMQYYQQLMTGLSYVTNPQLPPAIQQAAMQMVQGGSKLMRRILDNYGAQDADELIPDITQATQQNDDQLRAILALATGGAASGGTNGAGSGLDSGAAGYQGAAPYTAQPAFAGGGPYQAPPVAGTGGFPRLGPGTT